LQISWRPGRSLLEPSLSLDGLELLAITSRLFHEGDPHGFEETHAALKLLGERKQHGLLEAVWHLLDVAGWLGDLSGSQMVWFLISQCKGFILPSNYLRIYLITFF